MGILLFLAAQLIGSEGPIGKFSTRPPEKVIASSRAMWDIARCMIVAKDAHGPPLSYWQPDQPDKVTLSWVDRGVGLRRVDLTGANGGTTVTIWNTAEPIEACTLTPN